MQVYPHSLTCEFQCLPSLKDHPYLLEEEETYEPPEDPDSGAHFDLMHQSHMYANMNIVLMSGLSLEELGMRALERLPRDRAIDGIRAFNDMRSVFSSDTPGEPFITPFNRDDLLAYLRPFAQEGRIVSEADVRLFFESLREGQHDY